MRVVKSVSLTIEAAQKAENMDNFSVFVQRAIMEDKTQLRIEAHERRIKHLSDCIQDIYMNSTKSSSRMIRIREICEDSGVSLEA